MTLTRNAFSLWAPANTCNHICNSPFVYMYLDRDMHKYSLGQTIIIYDLLLLQ